MCIAILNNSSELSRATLNNSWNNNPEGAGLLWSHKGKIETFKTYKRKELLKAYYKLRAEIKTPIVLHFRIATSGHEKYTNLHPFTINEQLGFVHNGILTGLGNKQHSDTYEFNEMLKKLPSDFLSCPTTFEFIQNYISTSKLIFLDGNGKATIANERLGSWDDNSNWYSNDSHKYDLDFYYFGNQKVSKSNHNPTSQHSKVKATPTNNIQKGKIEIERAQAFEYLRSYFTGVNEHAVERLEYLLNIEAHETSFLWEVEDAARINACYDLSDLASKLERLNAAIYTREYSSYEFHY
jgi:hypothetical protein